MTARGKTAEAIEVCLSQPDLEVTCRIVFGDGSAVGVGVDSLSIAGAQREMTMWLMEQGYEPAGRWNTGDGELRAWAHAYLRRNEVIRAADAAGLSVGRIHEVTGIARTTIMRILGSPPSRRGQNPAEP